MQMILVNVNHLRSAFAEYERNGEPPFSDFRELDSAFPVNLVQLGMAEQGVKTRRIDTVNDFLSHEHEVLLIDFELICHANRPARQGPQNVLKIRSICERTKLGVLQRPQNGRYEIDRGYIVEFPFLRP